MTALVLPWFWVPRLPKILRLDGIEHGSMGSHATSLHHIESGEAGAGAAAAAYAGPTVTFLDSYVSTANATVYTFTTAGLSGGAVIVTPATRGSGTNANISSITIGGNAATVNQNTVVNAGGAWNGAAVAISDAGTWADNDVVVTYAQSQLRAGIGVWLITGLTSATPDDTATSTANPLTDTINVNANGFLIAAAGIDSATTPGSTWTGVAEQYDEAIEASWDHSGGHQTYAPAQTGLTIQDDIAGTPAAQVMAAASWH